MKINDLESQHDIDFGMTVVKCPKCGAISGDFWSQCEGLCPLDISPHFDEKTSKEFENE